jgi:hypothetical protein
MRGREMLREVAGSATYGVKLILPWEKRNLFVVPIFRFMDPNGKR